MQYFKIAIYFPLLILTNIMSIYFSDMLKLNYKLINVAGRKVNYRVERFTWGILSCNE